jgi:predicted ester cyclase
MSIEENKAVVGR